MKICLIHLNWIVITILLISGCKTVHMKPSEIINRQNNIALLKNEIDRAFDNAVDIFAPKHFEDASNLLDQAIKEARKSDDPNAGNEVAKKGLDTISSAFNVAIN